MIKSTTSLDSGEIEFRKATLPQELDALVEFDRLAFHAHPADLFPRDEWQGYETYWVVVNGKTVGCTAFEHGTDELWIASTAMHPAFRRRGLGAKTKKWQIEYAVSHGYHRIGTVCRASNRAIIALNEQFGFIRRKVIPHKYGDPDESGIEMELRLHS